MKHDMPHNPFKDCQVEGRVVASHYWTVCAANAAQAKRIKELFEAAYNAGRLSKMKEIKDVLIGDLYDEQH
jgi:hypothetical protein